MTGFVQLPNNNFTFQVLLDKVSDGKVRATILGFPDCKVEASTKEEALKEIKELLKKRLENSEIVSVEIEPVKPNPWLAIAGKYKDDPLFDEFLADMEAHRRQEDAQTNKQPEYEEWEKAAIELKNNPLFEEVLGYIGEARRELDGEMEIDNDELEVPAKVK
ncbi:hypothetical protein NG798_12515 [Ancylothrix sp. C2]|uniref:type II toxin-antitoxin system HicB family antitoxin n=1 Tax=Ancylothrix sp. D3o TaxID=2953691 RepID=UPI0021BA7204|nr:hypothetical protein [Ancylothrix sp. D3o]MCT7950616.1 hypothetical protein [Ancylothrix sp. D3o]